MKTALFILLYLLIGLILAFTLVFVVSFNKKYKSTHGGKKPVLTGWIDMGEDALGLSCLVLTTIWPLVVGFLSLYGIVLFCFGILWTLGDGVYTISKQLSEKILK